MTFLDRLNSPKFDFTKDLSGKTIIKFLQCQALTSHIESFWNIVHIYNMMKVKDGLSQSKKIASFSEKYQNQHISLCFKEILSIKTWYVTLITDL